jgi:hypothetical protein
VKAELALGTSATAAYGQLFAAFGAVLAVSLLIYAFAPERPAEATRPVPGP